ncbi:endonuclease/exonuclease/phosphatase family protein [Mucilaginibacter sp.]|jgi:endonuclease/exonuclease/phosphatase family metal-dependent hydrolase|uniref:endonuclease/exonuclease/phosphatase family protein n=1 Tax=Mucilaginibacter sp. TaxID=1882438 RepID=UPI003563506F
MRTKKTLKKKFPTFDKIVLILNFFATLALLLSYLAPSTDPRDIAIIAILGFGYPILLIVNLIFVFYWLMRKKILLLISLVSILLGVFNIQSFYGFHGKYINNKKVADDAIRIMQYNVREFKGIDKYGESPIQNEVAKVVNNNQPDILNLEEFSKYKSTNDSVTIQIKRNLKTNYNYFKEFKVVKNIHDSTGNMIFSKYPITNSGIIPVNKFLNARAIFVDVNYKGKSIRVYCIHLAAVKIKNQEKSRYLNGNVNIEQSTFIKNRLTTAFITRSFQVSQIKRFIEKSPYPYILTGDFNDTPNSFAVNEIGDGLKNAFIEKGSGYQTTYFSKFPLQIDYIFTSPEFDILNYQALDLKISDHKPLISDIKLN